MEEEIKCRNLLTGLATVAITTLLASIPIVVNWYMGDPLAYPLALVFAGGLGCIIISSIATWGTDQSYLGMREVLHAMFYTISGALIPTLFFRLLVTLHISSGEFTRPFWFFSTLAILLISAVASSKLAEWKVN